jgi:serine/threonine protein kinase
MGNSTSKSAKIDEIVSILGENSDTVSERETSSTWYRYGVEITDVYDVVEILGQGHMGEVFTVRRKTTGHHTEATKGKIQQLEAEAAQQERRGSRTSFSSSPADGNKGHNRKTSRTSFKSTFSKKKSDDSPSSPPPPNSKDKEKSPSVKSKVGKVKDKLKRIGHGDNDTVEADATLGKHLEREKSVESIHEPPALTAKPAKSAFKSNTDSKHHQTPSAMSIELPKDIGSDMSRLSMDRILSTETASTGATETTRKAVKGVHFQRTFAVKTILTSRINRDQVQEMVNEIMIMRKLDHPYVLKLYEVYHVKREFHVYIIVKFLHIFSKHLLQARFG